MHVTASYGLRFHLIFTDCGVVGGITDCKEKINDPGQYFPACQGCNHFIQCATKSTQGTFLKWGYRF